MLCLRFSRLLPLVAVLSAISRWKWLWGIRGMILERKPPSYGRESCPSAILTPTNLPRHGAGSKSGLYEATMKNNSLSTAFKDWQKVPALQRIKIVSFTQASLLIRVRELWRGTYETRACPDWTKSPTNALFINNYYLPTYISASNVVIIRGRPAFFTMSVLWWWRH
jgi:hypothetical protein